MESKCPNCGKDADGNYCKHCGQKRDIALPSLPELLSESLGALFSYDGKLWRTLHVLILKPGELTANYIEGKRQPFISPIQLFVWLQAITFLVRKIWFNPSESESDFVSRYVLVAGTFYFLSLCIAYANKRIKVVQHLLMTAHVWSFMMIFLLVLYALLPVCVHQFTRFGVQLQEFPVGKLATYSTFLVVVSYTYATLRRVYTQSWQATLLKTFLVSGITLACLLVVQNLMI